MLLQLSLNKMFKVQHTPLPLWVQRPVNVHPGVQILLHAVHQVVVLQFNSLEELASPVEGLFGRVRVPVYLILRGHRRWASRNNSHDEKVRGGQINRCVGEIVGECAVAEVFKVLRFDIVAVRWEVLESPGIRSHRVFIQIGDLGDSRVTGLAMIALGESVNVGKIHAAQRPTSL